MSSEIAKKRKRGDDGSAGDCEGGGDVVKGDQKWKYSAPLIPTSHWIDRGFDANYDLGMTKFLIMIKHVTCELRNGTCRENVYLGSSFGPNDSVLLHDDALLPHWREFVNALQLYRSPHDSHSFGIFNMQLTSSVMDLLTPALKDKPMKSFTLVNNEFANARDGIKFAIEVIQGNPRLKQFGWANNPIENMADANRLVRAVIGHPTIDVVGLYNCFGENVGAYEILCSLFSSNKSFATIALQSNNIRTGGRTEISDFLATNPPLKRLVLTNNCLNGADATLIARALKQNTNLRRLNLGQNDLTDVGHDALRNAIFDSTSLNTVADSNHRCNIFGFELDNINDDEEESKANRGRKIYSLLSLRNREGTNVRHLDSEFDDESMKLVPKVLESVNSYAEYASAAAVHPLSVTYEILRSWKMPTMYENG